MVGYRNAYYFFTTKLEFDKKDYDILHEQKIDDLRTLLRYGFSHYDFKDRDQSFSSYRSLKEVLEKYGIKDKSIKGIKRFKPDKLNLIPKYLGFWYSTLYITIRNLLI